MRLPGRDRGPWDEVAPSVPVHGNMDLHWNDWNFAEFVGNAELRCSGQHRFGGTTIVDGSCGCLKPQEALDHELYMIAFWKEYCFQRNIVKQLLG